MQELEEVFDEFAEPQSTADFSMPEVPQTKRESIEDQTWRLRTAREYCEMKFATRAQIEREYPAIREKCLHAPELEVMRMAAEVQRFKEFASKKEKAVGATVRRRWEELRELNAIRSRRHYRKNREKINAKRRKKPKPASKKADELVAARIAKWEEREEKRLAKIAKLKAKKKKKTKAKPKRKKSNAR